MGYQKTYDLSWLSHRVLVCGGEKWEEGGERKRKGKGGREEPGRRREKGLQEEEERRGNYDTDYKTIQLVTTLHGYKLGSE